MKRHLFRGFTAFHGRALALAILCALALSAEQASAHAVYIFAWADGSRLCTQSYFTKSSKVIDGEIIMANSQGDVLDKGRSNDVGLLCFAPPREAQDIVFTVKAGQGHRGEFLLPAADVRQAVEAGGKEGAEAGIARSGAPLAATAAPAADAGTPPARTAPAGPASPGSTPTAAMSLPAGSVVAESGSAREQTLLPLSREELRTLIRRELQEQFSPLRQELAAQKNSNEPGLRDILGGLGWIFGLAAAGALYYSRRQRS